MEPLKKIKFYDFANIFNLKASDSLENTLIKSLKFYKKSKKLSIDIKTSQVINQEDLQAFTKELKKNINTIKNIQVNIDYNFQYKSLEELVALNWDNLLYILKRQVPAFKAIEEQLVWEVKNNLLTIKVEELFILQKAKERRVERSIEKYFKKQFNITIKCTIISEDNTSFNLSAYEKEKERESIVFIDKLRRENVNIDKKTSNIETGGRAKINSTSKPGILLGKNFSGNIISIGNISSDLDTVIIEGEVFQIDYRELNSGKTLTTIQITDYNNSITIKVFEDKNKLSVKEGLRKGEFIRVRGNVVYDKYIRENILMARDIMYVFKEERKDLSETKE